MIFLMALAGGLGAVARWSADALWNKFVARPTPLATAMINVVGSFILGFVTGISAGSAVSLVIGFGFCGGFTTFSTASVEVAQLIRHKRYYYAASYAILMCVVSVISAVLGVLLGAAGA